MKFAHLLVILSILSSSQLLAQATRTIEVSEGDVAGLRDAIDQGNLASGVTRIVILESGDTPFIFNDIAVNSDNALPDVSGDFEIEFGNPEDFYEIEPGAQFPETAGLVRCVQQGKLTIKNALVSGFRTEAQGILMATESCMVTIDSSLFSINAMSGDGSVLFSSGVSIINIIDSKIENNFGEGLAGVALITEAGTLSSIRSSYINNGTSRPDGACTFYIDSNWSDPARPTADIRGNVFNDFCSRFSIFIGQQGNTYLENNSILTADNGFFSNGAADLTGNLFRSLDNLQILQRGGSIHPKPTSDCGSSNVANLHSGGYNLSTDDSCNLDESTDLNNTDPMLIIDANGYPLLRSESAAIDAGPIEVRSRGDGPAILPCPWIDQRGTARPQDGSNDGVFECDIGAIEAIGPGSIVDGHSGAFYNASRDGEGIYVEILNSTTAIIYTFTYRPDGSGPSWFIGVAEIRGNSLIVKDLLRPIGTSFGSGFDAADIEFTAAGSMNVVVPNCVLASPGGSVAYTGEPDIGYEALITRAVRLSNITGCGPETPSPNAGLSGSYFDPTRDGEGIVVEWLTNGTVLVVFFTYDENDNQLWLLGIGTPNGNTVTMDALYASSVTSWGSDFDPDEVTISVWGTFTLTWTECGGVRFEYTSNVGNYGNGMHDYTRLSTLSGTTCPDF
jgi:hypothetical protein